MRSTANRLISFEFHVNWLLGEFRDVPAPMASKRAVFKLGAEAVIQQRARMSRLCVKMLAPTVAWKCFHPLVKQRESPSTRLR